MRNPAARETLSRHYYPGERMYDVATSTLHPSVTTRDHCVAEFPTLPAQAFFNTFIVRSTFVLLHTDVPVVLVHFIFRQQLNRFTAVVTQREWTAEEAPHRTVHPQAPASRVHSRTTGGFRQNRKTDCKLS